MSKKFSKKLQKRIDEIMAEIDSACEKAAKELSGEIEDDYEDVIDEFYADYEPRSYQRTENTKYASDAVEDWTVNVNHVGNHRYSGGIHLDPSNMNQNWYRADVEWVYPRTFVRGIHGWNVADIQRFNTAIIARGKSDYRFHRFPGVYTMSPRPLTIMNQKMKKYTNDYVKSVVVKYIEQ